nr:hypothetical protein [Tanacetum cinerariifolium]
MVRQKAILDLALQFDNARTAKDERKITYKKCNDIPQESRTLIDAFLKEGSDKDYDLNLYEEAIRETLEEQARDEKERVEKIRIIPGAADIVQQAKLLKERDILLGWDGAVMSTQEYMKKVVEDVSDDEDFKSGS